LADHPILELQGVSKRFGAVQALYDVDFEARLGDVVALVGDNGAGKSTLVKGIAGIYSYDTGKVLFDGQAVHINSPKDSARLGIEVVYQDLALADNLDVVANMFLGRETAKWPGRLDEAAMEKATIETLASLFAMELRDRSDGLHVTAILQKRVDDQFRNLVFIVEDKYPWARHGFLSSRSP